MRKRNIVIRTCLIVLLLFKFGKRSEGAPLVFASVFRKGVILLANNFFLSQGAFGKEMSRWVTKEVKGRHFDSNGKCALGLEVDFRGGKGCDVRSKSKNVKKRIRRLFGFNIKASIRLRLKGLIFRVPRVNYTSFL